MREVAIVRDVNNNELFFADNAVECQKYCADNNITGDNGEYIAIGMFDETTKYFDITDYEEIR